MAGGKPLNIMMLERLSGLLGILVILYEHGEINYQQYIDVYKLYPNFFYLEVKKSIDLCLVSTRIDNSSCPSEKIMAHSFLIYFLESFIKNICNTITCHLMDKHYFYQN